MLGRCFYLEIRAQTLLGATGGRNSCPARTSEQIGSKDKRLQSCIICAMHSPDVSAHSLETAAVDGGPRNKESQNPEELLAIFNGLRSKAHQRAVVRWLKNH